MLAFPAGGTRMSAKIDYEIAEYDVFATKAQTLLDLGFCLLYTSDAADE